MPSEVNDLRHKIVVSTEDKSTATLIRPGAPGPPGADGSDGSDGIGVPDPSTATAGQMIHKGAADWAVTDAPEGYMDPVLAKVPDAAVLANSPSIWYPEEDDANQATLEAAGYVRLGYAANPATFQILNDALQVDIPAAHTTYRAPGVLIPMAVGAGDDFDIVFVIEPSSYILAQTQAGEGVVRSFNCGFADTVADEHFTCITNATNVAYLKMYFSTVPGVVSTGTLGTLSNTLMYFMPTIIRINRAAGTVYYSAPHPNNTNGWTQTRRGTAVTTPLNDIYRVFGSVAFSGAATHATFGAQHTGGNDERVRLRAIWRLA